MGTKTRERIAATAAARQRVLDHLVAHVPRLTRQRAHDALVDANAHWRTGLRQVDAHLQHHPDALTAGTPDVPIALYRLLRVLARGGHPVVVPGCAHCGRTDRALPHCRPEGRICARCEAADPTRHKPCANCGEARKIYVRQADGTGLCGRCAPRRTAPCCRCQRDLPVVKITDAGPVCDRCYRHHGQPRRRCGGCGEVRPIHKRGRDGEPDLCARCNKTIATCSRCGRTRPCRWATTAAPICQACAPRPQRPCALCGQARPVAARWPLGPVCRGCYSHVRVTPQPCSGCGDVRPLIGVDEIGQRRCGLCSGAANPYTCRECGGSEEMYVEGRCVRCVLADRLRTQFLEPGGTSELLLPLVDRLRRAPRPRSALEWLRRDNGGAELLRRLIRNGEPLTHETLDVLGHSTGVISLRHMLVHVGVLPARNELLAQLEPWLDRALGNVAPAHRHLLRTYGHWAVLRKARARAARTRYTANSAARSRSLVRAGIHFLNWIDHHQRPLGELTQHDVDAYLLAGGTRLLVRDFLRWARHRRLIGDVDVPCVRSADPHEFLDDDQRWALVRRFLGDEHTPLDVRVAGCLTLLFGLRATRIVTLQASDLITEHEGTYLTIDQRRVILPPALGHLLQAQADTAVPTSIIGRVDAANQWLFPGSLAGRHAHPHALTARLTRYGVPSRLGRNAALLALATDLPAAVLASQLGLSIEAAVHWVRRAKRDWHGFLAARADDSTNEAAGSTRRPG